MKIARKRYEAFFFKQRTKAPIQCSFVATSADVSDWAGVPIKTSSELRNFQRPEIPPHITEIEEFFTKYETNCSPSSIVVGFRKAVSCLNENGEPLGLTSLTPKMIQKGFIEIPYVDPVDLNKAQKREFLRELIAISISDTSKQLEAIKVESIPVTELTTEDAEAPEDTSDIGDNEVQPEVSLDELDQSQMMKEKQDFITNLKTIDVSSLEEAELNETLYSLLELSKPGIIIDGQHRVKGTKKSHIFFCVTALPEAPWSELAFQFIVLNKSARQVQDSLLINIVGNSLTPPELTAIEKRLNDSGIDVPLYKGVMRLHEDPDSPFYQKLRFGLREEKGIIDAAAAKTKIINFWFKCKPYKLIEHLLPGKTKAEKIHHWLITGMWYEYLKLFWGNAKNKYEGYNLWTNELEADKKTPVSKLMRVTIINLTQETIIEHMIEALQMKINNDVDKNTTMATLIKDKEDFKKYVNFYFEKLTPDFFQDWGEKAKGFDGSKTIRDEYKNAVRAVIGAQKTVPSLKKAGPNQHLLYQD